MVVLRKWVSSSLSVMRATIPISAVLGSVIIASSQMSFAAGVDPSDIVRDTTVADEFPVGVWGETDQHCTNFMNNIPANAWKITYEEMIYREVPERLSVDKIVSGERDGSYRVKLIVKPFPDEPDTRVVDIWSTDQGKTLLMATQSNGAKPKPQRFVACPQNGSNKSVSNTAPSTPDKTGKITFLCDVGGRGTSNRWLIYVSVDPTRGAYAVMNVNQRITGQFGIFGIDVTLPLGMSSF